MPIAERFRAFPLLIAAVTVAAGYYVGVRIGLSLTFPLVTTSVLWPPNAILTTALLLVPVRHWWVCLAAALPVHFALELGAGMPPGLVGLLFLTNCSEAVVAAGGMRLLSDAPTEFNTFRRVVVFLFCAVLAAPILSSFADAAVVHVFKGEPYWTVFRTRVFGNALTELSIVPCAVRGLLAIVHGVRKPTALRVVEAVALALASRRWPSGSSAAACKCCRLRGRRRCSFCRCSGPPRGSASAASAPRCSCLRSSRAMRRDSVRPRFELSPLEGLMAVQVYLIVIGVPLMCMAALLEERRRGALDLADRLKFEALLSTISQGLRPHAGRHGAGRARRLSPAGWRVPGSRLCVPAADW